MKAIYDSIGTNYAVKRQTDPLIAQQIYKEFEGAERILNIGAGAGSYEPEGVDLTAVEPSQKMIDQRGPDAHPVIQGSAESLPFADKSFSHAMTVLSMHHWINRPQAFKEINRVTSEKFVAVSWNPESEPFWLTRDYFPELFEIDKAIFPKVDELSRYFDDVRVRPLLIPENCIDGFLAAYWKRPEVYLNEAARKSISTFTKLGDAELGLKKLRADLESGKWKMRNAAILKQSALDAGYVLITAKIKRA